MALILIGGCLSVCVDLSDTKKSGVIWSRPGRVGGIAWIAVIAVLTAFLIPPIIPNRARQKPVLMRGAQSDTALLMNDIIVGRSMPRQSARDVCSCFIGARTYDITRQKAVFEDMLLV